MKKRSWLPVLALLLALSGCSGFTGISRELGVNLSAGEVRSEYDSHGGFHGDGKTYKELRFGAEADRVEAEIAKNGDWRSLPLTENLKHLAENAMPSEGEFTPLTEVQKGYYYFLDRHSESKAPKDDAGVMGRSSRNYTLAVYDTEKGVLYYVALDT